MDGNFARDIINIKSACCEFLEILLNNLEININKLIDYIYEPLLIIMNNNVNFLDEGVEL